MNKEIKIIDLLNMIAEGKEVPKFKFEKRDSIWEYNPLYFQFQSKSSSLSLDIMPVLNESVELIEEDNNKIKNLSTYYDGNTEEYYFYNDGNKPNNCLVGDAGTQLLIDKINEIIDKINNL